MQLTLKYFDIYQMRVKAVGQYIARMVKRVQKVDLCKPISKDLRIGPLTYGQWDHIMNGIFADAKQRSTIVLSYELETLDELLIFSRKKSIELQKQLLAGKELTFNDLKPMVDERWSPQLELWPMLNNEAAESLGYKVGDQYFDLGRYSSVYLDLRTLLAKIQLGEEVTAQDIASFNKYSYLNRAGLSITYEN